MSGDANSDSAEQEQLKAIGWAAYFVIALIYAIYACNWGDFQDRSFWYCLGRGLVWPFVLLGSFF
ncbi:MAG: hypothetical protein LBB76_06140 [Azoarcus sp.]|jgi:hypothetical protein|nr:hypothetical protein [Azoarcus sp.]